MWTRIFESWMKRFYENEPLNSKLLPGYVPVSGGHPGHNRDDFIVPFFPLIKAGQQYKASEAWGYIYDSLVPAEIEDSTIRDCSVILPDCPICDANSTCINCTDEVCGVSKDKCSTKSKYTRAEHCKNSRFNTHIDLKALRVKCTHKRDRCEW